VAIEWEAALEVRRELGRAAAHVPGAILELRVQQEAYAELIDIIGDGQRAALAQRVQTLTGSIGAARQVPVLRPAAIGISATAAASKNRREIMSPSLLEKA